MAVTLAVMYKILFLIMVCGYSAGAQTPAVIDTIVAKLLDRDNFSGTVLVAKNGSVVYSRTAGFSDRSQQQPFSSQTPSSIASVGKMFTAVIAMRLVERGKLNLSKHIADYLPGTKIHNAGKITISQLLNHTSGLGNYMAHSRYAEVAKSAVSSDAFIPLIEEMPAPRLQPGSQYEYSNTGYIILGEILEKITGGTYEDIVRKYVARPCGMEKLNYKIDRAAFGINAKGYIRKEGNKEWTSTEPAVPFPAADGGVYTTALDLFRFDQALYSKTMINEGSVKAMRENLVDAVLPGVGKMKYGYGLMRFDYNKGVYSLGHNGGFPGYACEYKHFFFPDKTEYTLIILANYDRVVRPVLFEIQQLILQRKI
ncbi:MAG: beta-lactamase family protein [Gemmatimonadaceae bacterium]|nr:beta-lactamase family protein [Chitinophagaceae bacterium]